MEVTGLTSRWWSQTYKQRYSRLGHETKIDSDPPDRDDHESFKEYSRALPPLGLTDETQGEKGDVFNTYIPLSVTHHDKTEPSLHCPGLLTRRMVK